MCLNIGHTTEDFNKSTVSDFICDKDSCNVNPGFKRYQNASTVKCHMIKSSDAIYLLTVIVETNSVDPDQQQSICVFTV